MTPMSYKRKMERYGKLVPQADLIEQLEKEKGWRAKEARAFLRDLNEIVIENLSCGDSVRLLPGLFIEVMLHPGQNVYSFKEQKNVYQEPYPILMCRMTGSLKGRVYATDDDFEDKEDDRYGYDD